MKNKIFFQSLFILIFMASAASSGLNPVLAQSEATATVRGWFGIVWGDRQNGQPVPPVYRITDDAGQTFRLDLDPALAEAAGGILALNGKRVVAEVLAPAAALGKANATLPVKAIGLEDEVSAQGEASALAATGSKPFVTILCKFSDVAAEPQDEAFFDGMYGDTSPGLNHYWKEVSYNLINVNGSDAYDNGSSWFTLPHPRSYYVSNLYDGIPDNEAADLTALAQDCTAQANPSVNFAGFFGINMMFNDDLDGSAWGGNEYLALDGPGKSWPVTWEPPFGYESVGVIAHEMGHAFGLPHSMYDPAEVYDNQWDVMSDHYALCGTWWERADPIYGCVGQHTISHHKDMLGWIAAEDKFTVPYNSGAEALVESLALANSSYKMAKIPIRGSSSHFYTVEARTLHGYDGLLPGAAIIIHDVNTLYSDPALLMDGDGDGDPFDDGPMWTVGETFTDAANGVSVQVLSATSDGTRTNGFHVKITNGAPRPSAFSKVSPANNSVNQPAALSLSWEAAYGADYYQYCYSLTTTCNNWSAPTTETSATLSGLTLGATYYWQVRAHNAYGDTSANTYFLWKFRVGEKPAAFGKAAPSNNAVNLPTEVDVSWNASAGVTPTDSYEYRTCADPNNEATCSAWTDAGLNASAHLSALSMGTVYFWQVRARNAFGVAEADGGAYWSFRTGEPPAPFQKTAPLNGATNVSLSTALAWNASSGISPTEYYEYCVNTTPVCPAWQNNGLRTSAELRGLNPSTTYYWQARAVNAFGATEANSGWSSFTAAALHTASFSSAAAQDGWILETSELANAGGTANAAGRLRVGDDLRNRQYRSILSFNTAPLPDNARVTSVALRIYKAASSSPDPFLSLGNLLADLKTGYFGTSAALAAGDFSAVGEKIGAGLTFRDAGGGWYELHLNPLHFQYLNLKGATQFRLRFERDDNNNRKADTVQFDSGGEANKPQLIVEYTLP